MEVVWLANHNAHTYFGLQVLGQLPPDLRELCTEDLPVFHLGLYGPDPLIFSLWTKKISDRLHKRWREESLPDLTDAIQTGSPTARSFAAGYILHHMLDDTVHPVIYGWMEEGSSHFRLEIAFPGRKAPGQFPQAAHRGKGAHCGHGGICAQAHGGPAVSGRSLAHGRTQQLFLRARPARDRRHPRPGKGTGP